MIKFSDYDNYPKELLDVAHWRDENWDMSDASFWAKAEEDGYTSGLQDLADWEYKNTDVNS